jgi:hypothetical protein
VTTAPARSTLAGSSPRSQIRHPHRRRHTRPNNTNLPILWELRVTRLESSMIAINSGMASDPAAPFGHVKQSGLGREGAHHGLLEFIETKYMAVSW